MRFSDADPERTWDGLDVAADNPRGTTIVVRRPAADGFEYLLLHRSERGVGHEGDWAWTAPAGARQPGEAVLLSARRELTEEAGLEGFPLWPVDLSGTWAVFGCDVPAGTPVDLTDPEHDRYEWVSFDAARARVLPEWVAAGNFCEATRAPSPRITFETVTYAGLPAPGTPSEQAFVAAIDGTAPGLHMVRIDDEPSGYIAHHPLSSSDDPLETIGLACTVDRGVQRVLWSYLTEVVRPAYPSVRRVLAPAPTRETAEAFERAGFTPPAEPDPPAPPEVYHPARVHTLDIPHIIG